MNNTESIICTKVGAASRRYYPYRELAAGIIRQAVLDDWYYRRTLRNWEKRAAAEKGTNATVAKCEINRINGMLKRNRDFFCSQYFEALCDADGREIYKAITENFAKGRKPLIERGRKDVRT